MYLFRVKTDPNATVRPSMCGAREMLICGVFWDALLSRTSSVTCPPSSCVSADLTWPWARHLSVTSAARWVCVYESSARAEVWIFISSPSVIVIYIDKGTLCHKHTHPWGSTSPVFTSAMRRQAEISVCRCSRVESGCFTVGVFVLCTVLGELQM